MAVSIHVYLPDEFEQLVSEIVKDDKRIRSVSSFVGFCIDEIAKRDYIDVYERVLVENERKKR